MKSFLFAVLVFAGVQSAHAQVGSPTRHLLNCSVPKNSSGDPLLGIGYKMECFTAPVSPRYSLRGCNLISRVVSPTAKAVILELKLDHQNNDLGFLSEEHMNIKVTVVKPAQRADVVWGNNQAHMTCLPARQ